jgi:hypothetical protein
VFDVLRIWWVGENVIDSGDELIDAERNTDHSDDAADEIGRRGLHG